MTASESKVMAEAIRMPDEFEPVGIVQLYRCRRTGKYAVVSAFDHHRQTQAGLESIEKALLAAGDHVRLELSSRPTDPPPPDPHTEPRAFVS